MGEVKKINQKNESQNPSQHHHEWVWSRVCLLWSCKDRREVNQPQKHFPIFLISFQKQAPQSFDKTLLLVPRLEGKIAVTVQQQ